jgi:hypothetical protein
MLEGAILSYLPACPHAMTNVETVGSEAPDTASIVVRTRMGLGLHHLLAAARFASRVQEVEQANQGRELGNFWDEIFQYSLGVSTSCVACLESYANELYFEGAHKAPNVSDTALTILADLVGSKPLLQKFSIALALRINRPLDQGQGPVQDIAALIKLRNAIVHFQPEWFDAQAEHAKVSRLLTHRVQASPFLPDEPLFPRAWASAHFAQWAVRSTVQFLVEYYSQAGLPDPLKQFRDRIEALLTPSGPDVA